VFVIIWRYEVQPSRAGEFVAAYGPDGEWARLFHHSSDFIGVDLVADDPPNSYVTIDRWQTEAAWHDFMDRHRSRYEQLDRRLDELTITEQLVSRGSTIG
jgi:hypothetical protein